MKLSSHITDKTNLFRILILLCSFGLVSCTKPIPVAFNTACQKENENISVSVEGYLRTGTSVLCSSRDGTRTCGLELVDTPEGTNKINVYLEEGTGKSQMEPLPKNYSKESLKVHDAEGNLLGAKDRVRVIGIAQSLNGAEGSSYSACYLNVKKIQRP